MDSIVELTSGYKMFRYATVKDFSLILMNQDTLYIPGQDCLEFHAVTDAALKL